MDEQRLAELFRDAVGEPPPATFGRDEVVAASQRIAATRRRSALAGGTLLGVAALAGALVVGGQVLQGEPSTAASQAAPEAASEPGARADADAPHVLEAPAGAPEARPFGGQPAGDPTPRSGPEDAQAHCGPVDEQLARALAEVLAARGQPVTGAAGAVPEPCAAGSRSAALPVDGGIFYVLVVPHAGQPDPVEIARPDGGLGYAVTLDGGRGLAVISLPESPGLPAPLSGEVREVAGELADRI